MALTQEQWVALSEVYIMDRRSATRWIMLMHAFELDFHWDDPVDDTSLAFDTPDQSMIRAQLAKACLFVDAFDVSLSLIAILDNRNVTVTPTKDVVTEAAALAKWLAQ